MRKSFEKLGQDNLPTIEEVHELFDMIKNIDMRLERARNACVTNQSIKPKILSDSKSGGTFACQSESKYSTPLPRHSIDPISCRHNSQDECYPPRKTSFMLGHTGSEYDPRVRAKTL